MKTHSNPTAPPEALKRLLLSNSKDLLTLPAAAAEALSIVQNPDCRINDLSQIVAKDPKLAADLLSLSNSATFCGGKPVADLNQAVVRLGLRQCRNLIVASCSEGMMKRLPLDQEWTRTILLNHSRTTASACVYLNRSLNLGFQGEEYVSGLLHDIGRMLLASIETDRSDEFDPLDFVEDLNPAVREYSIFETDHCNLGAWFVQQQGLPRAFIDSILLHHSPEVEGPNQRLVSLTAAGDHIANHLQRFGESEGYEPVSNRAVLSLENCIGRPLMQQFSSIATQIIDETCAEHDNQEGAGNATLAETRS